ncbi:hypothetical protein CY34DRAFT_813291, partial [Suillus luteus UH-Slu-Lm8-n1]
KGRGRWGSITEHGEKRSATKSTTGESCVRHVLDECEMSIENGLILRPANRESQISKI